MQINSATFVKSSPDLKSCPPASFPEYAFIGRSNVGKSSLINMVTGNRKLAKTSSTPGKTQLINHFLIDESWYLVDLPGIGYAKVSKSLRSGWKKLINKYLVGRRNLLMIFFLIDSRHPPQNIDVEFINWMGENELPFTLLFTKTDKLTKSQLNDSLENYKDYLHKYWEELPPLILTSSVKNEGKNEILEVIEQTNKIFD